MMKFNMIFKLPAMIIVVVTVLYAVAVVQVNAICVLSSQGGYKDCYSLGIRDSSSNKIPGSDRLYCQNKSDCETALSSSHSASQNVIFNEWTPVDEDDSTTIGTPRVDVAEREKKDNEEENLATEESPEEVVEENIPDSDTNINAANTIDESSSSTTTGTRMMVQNNSNGLLWFVVTTSFAATVVTLML